MFFVPYNSRDIRHKSIFSSTAAGESLWLSVCMPRDMGCSAVYLVVGADGENKDYIKLDWKSTDNITEWWSIEYTFREAGLYFYHFEYDTAWGRGRIFLHSEGKGHFSQGGREWQQTVYSPGFRTPSDFAGGVMYQIFPDRFYASGKKKTGVPADRVMHDSPDDIPEWYENEKFGRWNADFFGGDLKGIEMKLPYLKKLGVTCIYLNPIFEAHSNHRYDTADYMKIDPLLGTEKDFTHLCKEAEKQGIKILLDGVFSHTGADSIYFNMYNRYDSVGAYNSPDSEYVSWYKFKKWNDDYDSWWGVKTLPETNEDDDGFSSFIAGENGVVEKWMKAGAYGFRLDVADELPDSFIVKLRKAVKKVNPDGLLLGEVWEDASNKISHGGRRKYLLGDELDSVMNYPFRSAIINFMKNADAEDFLDSILTVCENYPPQVLDCLMNHLGTHDTERIFSILGGLDGEGIGRSRQVQLKLSEKQRQTAETLLKQAAIIQYTLPGVPSLYYGDEMLTEGLKDPFNRTFFPWNKEKGEVWHLFSFLGKLRSRYKCLKNGRFVPVSAAMGCVAYARVSDADRLLVIANNNPHSITYYLPEEWQGAECITGNEYNYYGVDVPANSAVILSGN
ncbi:MAG: glycoside hydrolase family 13 protein [Clostridia bacterium]|nr:glycoside hydrolase family 13 protein [Clostridia bacterium]